MLPVHEVNVDLLLTHMFFVCKAIIHRQYSMLPVQEVTDEILS